MSKKKKNIPFDLSEIDYQGVLYLRELGKTFSEIGKNFNVKWQILSIFCQSKLKNNLSFVPLSSSILCEGDFRDEIDLRLSKEKIFEVFDTLTEREKTVLNSRFFEEKTLQEIANDYHLTRESIRHIEAKALRKLRDHSRKNLLKWLLPNYNYLIEQQEKEEKEKERKKELRREKARVKAREKAYRKRQEEEWNKFFHPKKPEKPKLSPEQIKKQRERERKEEELREKQRNFYKFVDSCIDDISSKFHFNNNVYSFTGDCDCKKWAGVYRLPSDIESFEMGCKRCFKKFNMIKVTKK